MKELAYSSIYTIENFDNHGYVPPGNASPSSSTIDTTQITPLRSIVIDYSDAQSKINSNYAGLNASLTKYNDLRSVLVSNNKYNFDNTNHTDGSIAYINNKTPTIEDALKEDINTIIIQQNTNYILGSLCVASLLVFIIYNIE